LGKFLFTKENPPTHEAINALDERTVKKIIELSKVDFRLFCAFFCFTDDPTPRGDGERFKEWVKNKPLPFWREYAPYIQDFVWNEKRGIIFKARRLQATWYETAFRIHGELFAPVARYEVLALDEKKAWQLFMIDRYQHMLERIPKVFLPHLGNPLSEFVNSEGERLQAPWKVLSSQNRIVFSTCGHNTLTLSNTNVKTSRGGDCNGLHREEGAFSELGCAINDVYIPMLGENGALHILTTPNSYDALYTQYMGQYNLQPMAVRGRDEGGWMNELAPWIFKGESPEGFKILMIHNNAWTERAEGSVLFDAETRGLSKDKVRREYLLDFSVLEGEPVFSKYKEREHEMGHLPKFPQATPIYVGLDDGTYKGLVAAYINEHGQLVKLLDMLLVNKDYKEALHWFSKKMDELYGWKYVAGLVTIYPDPACFAREGDMVQAAQRIREAWGCKVLNIPKSNKQERAAYQNDIFGQRIEILDPNTGETEVGEPVMLISPACEELIKDYKSRYKYKERNGKITDEPFDDKSPGFFGRVHVMDADGYLMWGLLQYHRFDGRQKPKRMSSPANNNQVFKPRW